MICYILALPQRGQNMESEKFCLSWNDFQATISNSFKTFQKDGDFHDITLVTEDMKQLKAHKVILSACSEFFQTILKANAHSHPLIYLNGVDSTNMQFILEYMYNGKVSIYQDQLDVFLSRAQTLKVMGLIGDQEQTDSPSSSRNYKSESIIGTDLPPKQLHSRKIQNKAKIPKQNVDEKKLLTALSRTSETLPLADMSELDSKLEELTDRIDGVWTCKSCGRTAQRKRDLHWHIESHFGDLSLPCGHCDKTFRSKRSIESHIKTI